VFSTILYMGNFTRNGTNPPFIWLWFFTRLLFWISSFSIDICKNVGSFRCHLINQEVISEYFASHMRKKSENFRIESAARATSMVKFSARSDSKNLSDKNQLSGGPVKFRNKNFCLMIMWRPRRRICTIWNCFWTSHSVIRTFFRLYIRTPSRP
jgi:hypothetical protein